MRFTVGATRTAQRQLADLCVRADSQQRRAITAAAQRLDMALARSADTIGAPYPAGRLPTAKRLVDPPLAINFILHQSSGRAVVLDFLDASNP
jgi:hypothetical protein